MPTLDSTEDIIREGYGSQPSCCSLLVTRSGAAERRSGSRSRRPSGPRALHRLHFKVTDVIVDVIFPSDRCLHCQLHYSSLCDMMTWYNTGRNTSPVQAGRLGNRQR